MSAFVVSTVHIDALQARAITCLSGYTAAPWEIDDPRVFSAARR